MGVQQGFDFEPHDNSPFNKLGRAYQQYTIVGLKTELKPVRWIEPVQAGISYQNVYTSCIAKAQTDFTEALAGPGDVTMPWTMT